MLKAIATWYSGRLFRSKLEADWAEYFDFCDIQWAYEPEGYELSNGARYLPDFYLPRLHLFVECRGALSRSLRKTALFAKEAGLPVLVALPEGRFFLADTEDAETGEYDLACIEAMFSGDHTAFERFQKTRSCMVFLDDDAEGDIRTYFANCGDSSPDYCGYSPDWFNSMKDRNRMGNPLADARSYYYGGFSTWQLRGFQRRQVRVGFDRQPLT